MSKDYDYLAKRASVGVDGFDDKSLFIFKKFCQFLDSTGEDWSLDQIKTKFGEDDLRFYVSGSSRIQIFASALESFWRSGYDIQDDL